jgi:hypothetical protein
VTRGGNRSPYGEHILGSEAAWRERYWENFYVGATRKLQVWSYEQEYRLVLASELIDFSTSKDIRKAKYDFNDLDGIIFGMMTPTDKKLLIAKVSRKGAVRANRTPRNDDAEVHLNIPHASLRNPEAVRAGFASGLI